MTEAEILDLIRQARQVHRDAGNDPFHVGAVTVCEDLERVIRARGETNPSEPVKT